jgi:hypothetical protein
VAGLPCDAKRSRLGRRDLLQILLRLQHGCAVRCVLHLARFMLHGHAVRGARCMERAAHCIRTAVHCKCSIAVTQQARLEKTS